MKKKIMWLRWTDPLRLQETEDPEDSGRQSTLDSFVDAEDEGARHVRMISGPYGMIPVGEHGLCSKLYKLWVCHTNFDITPMTARSVEKVPGVEILRIWTRYRMWVGIANMFNTEEVQRAIAKELCEEEKKNEVFVKTRPICQRQEAALMMLEENLNDKHPDTEWAIYRTEDGCLSYEVGERQEIVRGLIEKGLCDNVVSTSW
jgi:hypothetical protein